MSRTLLLLCLLGLVAATKQQDDSSDTADASDASDASDAGAYAGQDAGYEAPATVAYAAPVHYAHIEVKPPAICYTGQCGRHARCFNRATGTCSPRACASPVVMHAASYGYADAGYAGGDEEAGYSGGDEEADKEGGRRLQYDDHAVAYGGDFGREGYPINRHCGCPHGTEDTQDWSMDNHTVFWVGFGLLFAPCVLFWWRAFNDLIDKNTPSTGATQAVPRGDELTEVRINAGMVNLVASLAYLAMATKHGFTTRCNGRDFYYARYVDWIITTPLMLWDLAIIGGSDRNTKLFLVFIDIFMIVSGLIGSLVDNSGAGLGGTNEKWGFFGMSMLAFIPIIWFLCRMDGKAGTKLTDRLACGSCGSNGTRAERAYQRAMNLTVLSWFCYPIIWIVAEGTNDLSVSGENIAYTVLDIIAKSVFGWILVYSNWNLANNAPVSGSSVL